ncbi:hypothetical protein KQH51_04610 [bacterium]|nr:hypothetical protein [bacterium]MCB2202200.1 hypothetical protein [bacterium]
MAEGKGMSKGCMVALVVAGAILVLIIASVVVCYIYMDDLAKTTMNNYVPRVKTLVAEQPPAGLDTAQFNALTDEFLGRFNADSLSAQQYGHVVMQFTEALKDEQITGIEADSIQSAILMLYPDLADIVEPTMDDMMDVDSTADALIDSASGM